MRRELIFHARIAEPNNQFHRRSLIRVSASRSAHHTAESSPTLSCHGEERSDVATERRPSAFAVEGSCAPSTAPRSTYYYFYFFFSPFSGFAASAPSAPSVSPLPFLITS